LAIDKRKILQILIGLVDNWGQALAGQKLALIRPIFFRIISQSTPFPLFAHSCRNSDFEYRNQTLCLFPKRQSEGLAKMVVPFLDRQTSLLYDQFLSL
jgi:hypothetical protein